MKKTIEQVLSYLLGLILGSISGFIIWSLHLTFLKNEDPYEIVSITTLIGLIISIAVVEFRKAQLMRKSNSVRNEAIALITHEMRTGLTSTGWAIQLVLQKYSDKISDEDKTNLEILLESIHTTIRHSVNLLDISILDLSKLSLSLEWTSLEKIEEVLNEVINEYTMGANKKNIILTSHVKLDKEKQVEVDILRLRIILGNLLENSLQYTLNDKKTIDVQINNTNKDLNITVSDPGIGIPRNEQKKIFEEFYRASNARAMLPTGSGIGLYACMQYVKAHRGTIRFKSKENEGATFYVTIPLKTAENVDEFMEKI
ncbi:MAG: HAMP domain-containing sensor histidine kinase [Candidatus Parcubacteria bacterium]|nr:HAMP domain-containing sensor histidine kinase [Candidatus Parcubacteria bacterium]